MPRKPYSTDMTGGQWAAILPLIPPQKSNFIIGGLPRRTDIREVVNGILYVLRSGCAWNLLPKEFPPLGTVKEYFYAWRDDGTWQRIHDSLLAKVRVKEGRDKTPSAAIIDSQSVKTTEKGASRIRCG